MNKLEHFCLRAAGVNGLMAVGFGAFAAHGLRHLVAGYSAEQLGRMLEWMETGARYQLLHAAALLALAGLTTKWASAAAPWTARSLFLGSLIFSVSLYGMALGGPLWLGAVTPVGGVLMLLGWGLLLFA
jgi:uncharacterized membrane protein YgdD (TMEM256/DUF423 family)